MYNHFNERSGQKAPLIADDVYEIIMKVYSCIRTIIITSDFCNMTIKQLVPSWLCGKFEFSSVVTAYTYLMLVCLVSECCSSGQ